MQKTFSSLSGFALTFFGILPNSVHAYQDAVISLDLTLSDIFISFGAVVLLILS